MKVIILAGGLGFRLRDRVPDLPKPMAMVAGRPFLEYVLDRLILSGMQDIILSVGYRADIIMEHFGEEYRGATLSYAVETRPLDTGGAIAHALAGAGSDPALVINGDTFLNLDYMKFIQWYLRTKPLVALVLREVEDAGRYGSVLVSNERITGFEEKGKTGPGLINAGVYIVTPSVFDKYGLSGRFSFEADLIQAHCDTLLPGAFITNAYFIDIGIPDDFDRAQEEFSAIT